MHKGLPKYVPVNLKDIEEAGFQEGEEVSLESLKNKGLINPSGRERKLPLKVLLLNLFTLHMYWLRTFTSQLRIVVFAVCYRQPNMICCYRSMGLVIQSLSLHMVIVLIYAIMNL